MESTAETTSPGGHAGAERWAHVALAAPGETDDGSPPVLPKGSLLYGGGVGVLVAIGIGTAYFMSSHGRQVEWAKLAAHLLGYCVATCAVFCVMLDRGLEQRASGWLASVVNTSRSGALAGVVPGAFALGHFARLRLDYVGTAPLAFAGVALVSLLGLRAACRHRGGRGYTRALGKALSATVGGAVLLAVATYTLAVGVAWPDEYELARMMMVEDLRAANLLDAFYYAVGAAAGAAAGATVGAVVGLWGLGRGAASH